MKNRKLHSLTYSQSINEALDQSMKIDKNVCVIGQLVNYSPGVFGTTTDLEKKYGSSRVQDFPVAESLMTSMSVGMAIKKKRIVLVHHRIDFLLYSMDAIVNWISLWRFKSNAKSNLSITIRAVVGKGWGQGPQHSKTFHSWFANLPGIRVAIPSTPFDAKGLIVDSIFSDSPTIIIEHRSLYNNKQEIPKKIYRIPFGKANILKRGKDITIVAIGYLAQTANRIAENIKKNSKISIEVIDVRTLSPIDFKTILKSVNKTKKVLILDPSWTSFGSAAEIMSGIYQRVFNKKKKVLIDRLSYPDSHTPASSALERKFYLDDKKIKQRIIKLYRSEL